MTDWNNQVYEYDPAGSAETNNTGVSVHQVQVLPTPRPDLRITTVSAPDDGWSGSPIEVRWTTVNETAVSISGNWDWVDAVYLSMDQTLVTDPNNAEHDTLLKQYTHTGGLPASGSYSCIQNVPLPLELQTGDYFIFVVVDASGNVSENNESNNQALDAGAVHVTQPPIADLQVLSVTAPTTAWSGGPLPLTWSVSNEGGGPTNRSQWTDAVYLSTDQTLVTSEDRLLGKSSHSGVLAAYGDPGSTYDRSASPTLPVDLPTGQYYVFVVVDSGGVVYEYQPGYDGEGNNVLMASSPVTVTLTPPDVSVIDIDAPAGATSGESVAISWTVKNIGSGTTPQSQWTDTVYLSTDGTLDRHTDTHLASLTHTGALDSDQSYLASRTARLPDGLSGTYWLFVVTDSASAVYESNENNNADSVSCAIQLTPPPDLQVTEVVVPAEAWSNQPMSVTWTVANAGPGPVRPTENSWADIVYLSADDVFNASIDRQLGAFTHNGVLANGGSYTQTRQVTLPVGISGDYWVFVRTDTNNRVYEHDAEDNNVGDPHFTVHLTSPPDLVVSSVDAPVNAYSAQPITISWTVANTGSGQTVPAGWYDRVYLSQDQYLDPSIDISLGYITHAGALNSGQSYSASLTANVPGGAGGPYYAFVVTDSSNQVFEHDAESNNSAFDPLATVITLAPPADLLLVSDISLPAAGTAGESPATPISWTVTNLGTATAMGTWYDVVYLSADVLWDLSDPVITRVSHSGDVAVGGSYTASTSAKLPAAVPGDYHIIVRTDIRNQVRESEETNNWLASIATVAMDVPVLQLSTPISGTLGRGEQRYYRLEAQAGQDVAITLATGDPSGVTELYVSYGSMPDRTTFGLSDKEPFTADHEIVITGARAGTYYVLVNVESLSSASTSFTLTAEALEFSLRSIGPAAVGNAGPSTITLSGIRLPYGSLITAVAPDGGTLDATKTWWVDPQTIYATFDFTGADLGLYDVEIVTPDGLPARLDDALAVTAGTGPQLEVNMSAPAYVGLASGVGPRYFQMVVEYANTGDADMPAPYFILDGLEGAPVSLYPVAVPDQFTLHFLGINQDGPAGILTPGAHGQISIYGWMRGMEDTGTLNYELYAIAANDEPADWSEIATATMPDDVDADAWTALWQNFTANVGSTWGDYLQRSA